MHTCFATTNKGLENLLKEEIEQLGAKLCEIVNAGIKFEADLNSIMKINLHSRLASRVMLQVAFGSYNHEEDIYNISRSVKWQEWFNANNSLKISTTAKNSPLRSLEFITLKVKDAICDYFVNTVNDRPDINKQNPDVRIYNFLTKDTVTIYLDTSGEALFKRGFRQNHLEAPLKENLAAGLIKFCGWQKHMPFYDPMCGSGTIVMEAVSIGLNIAPGLNRQFGFERLKQFDLNQFKQLKEQASMAVNYNTPLKIYASDISNRAISLLQSNLKTAKLMKYVKISQGDFLDQKAPDTHGVLLCNPPYGVRLDEQEELAKFYPLLGDQLKRNYTGWDCYFLSGDLRLPKLIRLKVNRKIPMFNGALDCRLFEFKMVTGSNR
ncbi:MAG: methyltransferase [Burkholderiales bacterium]|nr:methyltransferase [Burkholderiales bacterium]